MAERFNEDRITSAEEQVRRLGENLHALIDRGILPLGDKLAIGADDALLLEAEFQGMSRFAQFVLNSDERIEDVIDEIGSKYFVSNIRERLGDSQEK